jgi:hypothetical protein
MKNPVTLTALWDAMDSKSVAKMVKSMDKLNKANSAAFAAWVAANKGAWSAPFTTTNPAAVLAAA